MPSSSVASGCTPCRRCSPHEVANPVAVGVVQTIAIAVSIRKIHNCTQSRPDRNPRRPSVRVYRHTSRTFFASLDRNVADACNGFIVTYRTHVARTIVVESIWIVVASLILGATTITKNHTSHVVGGLQSNRSYNQKPSQSATPSMSVSMAAKRNVHVHPATGTSQLQIISCRVSSQSPTPSPSESCT